MNKALSESLDTFGVPLDERAHTDVDATRRSLEYCKNEIRRNIVNLKYLEDEKEGTSVQKRLGGAIRDLDFAEVSIAKAIQDLDIAVRKLRVSEEKTDQRTEEKITDDVGSK